MFGWFKSKPKKVSARAQVLAKRPRSIHARLDSAQTTADNQEHWKWTDSLSADAAYSPGTRQIIRERARYEIANNSYARGVITTLANDCVGTGPRLQMLSEDETLNDFVESEFSAWLDEICGGEKIRQLKMAKDGDGEGLGFTTTNDDLFHPVKLDFVTRECDRLCSPLSYVDDPRYVDGVEINALGYPVAYHIRKTHPGADYGGFEEFDRMLAQNVIHVFNADRPEQHRGIPTITPALPLFALLRRFTLATVQAAEAAADIAVIFEQVLADAQEPDAEVEAWDEVPITRGMMMAVEKGMKPHQMAAEHPGTTYDMFKREILGEIARCMQVPINVITGDSSKHNFASGKLDHLTYVKAIEVEQSRLNKLVLDRLFSMWKREAVLIEGYLPQSLRMTNADWRHAWFWQGTERTIDEQKKENAIATGLANNTTTLEEVYAKKGMDWRKAISQRAKEVAMLEEMGVPFEPFAVPTQEAADATED